MDFVVTEAGIQRVDEHGYSVVGDSWQAIRHASSLLRHRSGDAVDGHVAVRGLLQIALRG